MALESGQTSPAVVLVGGEAFALSPEQPLLFGRADATDLIGLDATGIGTSAVAGSIEWAWGLWWVVNRSGKRHLILDDGAGFHQPLGCGRRHAICVPRRHDRPLSYQQAADLLGPPWTRTTVRKQIERLKQRPAVKGVYVEGPQADFDLDDHLIGNGLIRPADLGRPPDKP